MIAWTDGGGLSSGERVFHPPSRDAAKQPSIGQVVDPGARCAVGAFSGGSVTDMRMFVHPGI